MHTGRAGGYKEVSINEAHVFEVTPHARGHCPACPANAGRMPDEPVDIRKYL